MKLPKGRPTKYSEELEEKAWEYINGGYKDHDHAVPSVVGLCSVLQRARSTIYDWASHDDKNFSDILDAMNESQELVAFNRGLTGDYNATIVKLLLGKHGYHDKQDQTLAGPGGGPVEHDHVVQFIGVGDDAPED